MSRRRYIGYRCLWAGFASVAASVVLFLIVFVVGDIAGQAGSGTAFAGTDRFLESDSPMYIQYFDWMGSFLTLDWGTSQRFGRPVAAVLAERAPVTAAYLLPAVVFGTAMSTAFGYIAALKRKAWSDRALRGLAYLVLALPNFILGALAYEYMNTRLYDLNASFYQLSAGIFTDWNLFWLLIATAIVGTHVAAVQMRQTRRQINEYLGTDFTKQLHAKGVSPLRFARHVLRAAVVPLTSLFVAEVLGLLLVSVFVVEAVLDIPGLGAAAWTAVNVNDGPLVLTLAVFLSVVIILASLLEDVVAVVFDPRLDK